MRLRRQFPRGSTRDSAGRARPACAVIDDMGSGEPCPWIGSQIVELADGSRLQCCHTHARLLSAPTDAEWEAAGGVRRVRGPGELDDADPT